MTETRTKLMWRSIAIVFVAVFLTVGFNEAGFATSSNLQSQKRSIEKKLAALRGKLTRLKKQGGALSSQINQIDREIDRANRDLNRTILELNRNRVQQQTLRRQLDETIARYTSFRGQYKDRLVSYYKNGRSSYLEVLFNSRNFGDLISRAYYVRLIARHDIGVMDELRNLRQEVETKKLAVEAAGRRIESLKSSIEQKKSYSEGVKREKKNILRQVQNDAQLTQEAIQELEAANRQIEAELRRMAERNREIGPFTGVIGSPMCGAGMRITSSFGYRKRPTRGASQNHHGIDISAKYGQPICAAADGVVFSAGWRNGYGRTVILMHGSGLATVYAHGLSVLVSAGQTVRRGEVIMRADSSGISTGNHLHFEVRKDGVAVNPMGYLR